METITDEQVVKENAIRLAEHHKKHCDGADCNISLYMVRRLLEMAGIELSDEEKKIFL
jgi:hypothetical protein